MADDQIQSDMRGLSQQRPRGGPPPVHGATGEGDVIRLLKRYNILQVSASALLMLTGLQGMVSAGALLNSSIGDQTQLLTVVVGIPGAFNVLVGLFLLGSWFSRWRRKPYCVIGTDRLVFVENHANATTEIPYEAIDRLELCRWGGSPAGLVAGELA